MSKKIISFIFLFGIIFTGCSGKKGETIANKLKIVNNNSEQKVDVLVDGKLFTSYLYTDKLPVLKKPVLFPIVAANGATITRGYPLNPRANERTDHPHHIGAWLNYGNVNGLDYWGNSDAITEKRKDKMGTIRHEKIVSIKNDNTKSELIVTANWLKPNGDILLEEKTHFVFRANDSIRIIDRITTLTPLKENVLFKDTKEGMLGIRVAHQLELPSNKPVFLSNTQGNKTEVTLLDSTGVSGNYISSEGVEGLKVWGKRAKWISLSGTIESKEVSVVIMDSPDNVGHPTYWHARGYGLFAVNPLGQKAFSKGKEELNFSLDSGASVTFSYRVEIINGKRSKKQLDIEYQKFVNE